MEGQKIYTMFSVCSRCYKPLYYKLVRLQFLDFPLHPDEKNKMSTIIIIGNVGNVPLRELKGFCKNTLLIFPRHITEGANIVFVWKTEPDIE